MKKTKTSVNIQVMKRLSYQAIDTALFIRGFIAIIMQILLIREFLIIFNGNELTLGIILTNWLILEAIGSGVIGRLADKIKELGLSYILLQVILGLSLPISIWILRLTRQIFHITTGEVISVVPMFVACIFVLTPIAVIDGAQFSFGCKLYSSIKEARASSIGKVYILEALGMLAGGLIFTYLFLKFLNSFQIAFLLSMLCIISAAFLEFSLNPGIKKNLLLKTALLAILVLNISIQISGKVGVLEKQSISRQWNKENVVAYKNSIYGNITVIKKERQFTFFSNGSPTVTTPVPDIASIEDFTHFPMLMHPSPKKILIISSAVGGMLTEILKYPAQKIDYVELDPLIIELVNKFPTALTFKELMDNRVHIKFQDGRSFVKNSEDTYDVIFVNLGMPSSLQLNRFYTLEFLKEANKILNKKGIIVLKCWGSLVYLGNPQKNINASILKTLQKSFKNVNVIPGETNIYIASQELALDNIRAQDIKNWKKLYNIKTRLLNDAYIDFRLDPYWKQWFLGSLAGADRNVLNRDFTPRGLFWNLNLLYNLISPKTKYFFNAANKINFLALFIIIAIFNIIFLIFKKTKKLKRLPIAFIIGITGFSGITFQLVIILGFQIVFGFLYYWIGVLTAGFMLGLALGAQLINSNLEKIKQELRLFLQLETALLLFAVALPIILSLYNLGINQLLLRWIFFFLSVLSGFLTGTEFPLANKIYWKDKDFIGQTAGAIYAADLIGSCIGCLLVPIAFIPVIGILKTCLLVALLKLSSLFVIKNFS